MPKPAKPSGKGNGREGHGAATSPIDAMGDLSALHVIDDNVRNILEMVSINEKIELLGNAISSLPGRCRQIVMSEGRFIVAALLGLAAVGPAERATAAGPRL